MARRWLIVLVILGATVAGCSSGASEEDVESVRAEVAELRADLDRLSEAVDKLAAPTPPASATTPTASATTSPTAEPTVEPTPESQGCVLSIESFSTELRSGTYEEFAGITFVIRSSSERQVKAWRLGIIFDDPFGNELFVGAFNNGSAAIPPGETEDAPFSYKDNQFIDDEPYDYLGAYAVENLELEIVLCEVSFVES